MAVSINWQLFGFFCGLCSVGSDVHLHSCWCGSAASDCQSLRSVLHAVQLWKAGRRVLAGRSGLVVTCQTALHKILGSSPTVGSLCIYHRKPLQYTALGMGYTPFLLCLGQLSLLSCVVW